ncbi:hypothetical protein GN958_ATG05061 [Phytophthora infestans]|uniref:Uncharacterized protein n=1 Tax=Phytophthora infestans TaxID=4787 RepID=A0A8S9V2M5_PHYIN|nr:hypothetical protein GN958_ATG05061 [Phytophthora infestans]
MLVQLRRVLLGRCGVSRALLSTTNATDSRSFKFESLALDDDQLLPSPVVTQRVLKYLQVDTKDIGRSLSIEEVRPLPYKALFAPKQVHKLAPLVRWGFQQLEGDPQAADAVFVALEPHANMARGAVWRQFFQRQFFLSGAPTRAYLRAYKSHSDALDASRAPVSEDTQQERSDDDEMESKDAKISWRNEISSKNKMVVVLAEQKEWEWVPLHVASSIVKEFCFRGRFAEAIEAYASLPLTDLMRRDVVIVLQDYEQYQSVLYLYEVHRAMGSAVKPLDVAPELDALKKVGRVEEMDMRFQELPAKEQSRADIQKIMGN